MFPQTMASEAFGVKYDGKTRSAVGYDLTSYRDRNPFGRLLLGWTDVILCRSLCQLICARRPERSTSLCLEAVFGSERRI